MWIVKGILLGVWLFSFGWLFSIAPLYLTVQKFSAGRGSGMFGIELLLPISSLSFWLWLVAWLAFGLAVARSWPIKPFVWVGLAITELFPVGLLAMILGLAVARSWPIKPFVWVGLVITELFPVGLLAMILVLVSRLKAVGRP